MDQSIKRRQMSAEEKQAYLAKWNKVLKSAVISSTWKPELSAQEKAERERMLANNTIPF